MSTTDGSETAAESTVSMLVSIRSEGAGSCTRTIEFVTSSSADCSVEGRREREVSDSDISFAAFEAWDADTGANSTVEVKGASGTAFPRSSRSDDTGVLSITVSASGNESGACKGKVVGVETKSGTEGIWTSTSKVREGFMSTPFESREKTTSTTGSNVAGISNNIVVPGEGGRERYGEA